MDKFRRFGRTTPISNALADRRGHRRVRRSKLRFRAPRFLNRGNKKCGWLPPSLQHRVDTVSAWVNRISRWAPITGIVQELVKFDMQQMQNPEVFGIEYQQGTLEGYEVREYLLEKWNRTCAYCGKKDIPLQIDHIQPRSKGGSNRVSNLTLACQCCNQKKDASPVEEFLINDPVRLKRIKAQAKAPLRDAAAVNATRWALFNNLKKTDLPVVTGTGGQTKFNRGRFDIPKSHALDAACVGQISGISDWVQPTLSITAMGRGSYQRTLLDKFGCTRSHLTRQKSHFGFQTGDMVKADVTKGKRIGIHTGRVAIKKSGYFTIQTKIGKVTDIAHRFCKLIQRNDGYGYSMVHFKKDVGLV